MRRQMAGELSNKEFEKTLRFRPSNGEHQRMQREFIITVVEGDRYV